MPLLPGRRQVSRVGERLLAAVEREPGIQALTVQYEVRRECMVDRGTVSSETAHLVARGDLVLDGELRLWPGGTK